MVRFSSRWLVLVFLTSPVLCFAASTTADYAARVTHVLKQTPLIDGHNDLPWEIRQRFHSKLSAIDLRGDTHALPVTADDVALMTDIPRLRLGQVGGQFWSVYVPVEMHESATVQATIEQIDIVRQMTQRYPADLEMAYTAADIRRIHQSGRIASLVGV